MKTTFALILAALVAAPSMAFAGDTSASGTAAPSSVLTATITGTGPVGQPIGACVATATSQC